jgi:predicted PurR-regulated permease PerM
MDRRCQSLSLSNKPAWLMADRTGPNRRTTPLIGSLQRKITAMNPLPVDTAAPLGLRDRCVPLITAGVVLALLYVGRDVLIPLVVAIMLSLLVAPLVRVLRRVGIGRASSVLIAVLVVTLSSLAVAGVLGTQVLRMAASLPQYQATVQRKIEAFNAATEGRLTLLTSEATHLLEAHEITEAIPQLTGSSEQSVEVDYPKAVGSEPRQPAARPFRLIGTLVSSAWASAQAVGIVLLVLIFVLLEHESLRDRFIRLIAATDIRLATLALNDAGERLSRFFASQFVVNLAFGLAIWLSLSLIHVPQAMLFGTLAGVMRFVPYVGIGIAALLSSAFAFAIEPGWSLAASTLAIFILLDIIVGQLVEPHLYGHATGLSPLSVVVAAIFWSSLWGPVGLILSVPLTLCLVVAGRHIKALGILELLLSDAQALTLPQKFYQRALSGDPHEIITDARAFLKRNSLAAYCDRALIPALHLAHLDADTGAPSEVQQLKIRRVVVDVVSALSSDSLRLPRRRYGGSVLDDADVGHWLRQQREQVSGPWQGPLGVPPGSVVICLGLGSPADDLVAELFARVLLSHKIDARHFSPADLDDGLPQGADPDGVSIIYLMSAFPSAERDRADALENQAQGTFPDAHVMRVFCPGVIASPNLSEYAGSSALVTSSLMQAIQMCTVSAEPRAARTRTAIHA